MTYRGSKLKHSDPTEAFLLSVSFRTGIGSGATGDKIDNGILGSGILVYWCIPCVNCSLQQYNSVIEQIQEIGIAF